MISTRDFTESEVYRAQLFEKRLADALSVARGGETAIVIVPAQHYIQEALNTLAHIRDPQKDWNVCHDGHNLYFSGTRGSVRLYPQSHATYDTRQQRLLDYPAGTKHFLHPEVEWS